jgi:hypothetical protein
MRVMCARVRPAHTPTAAAIVTCANGEPKDLGVDCKCSIGWDGTTCSALAPWVIGLLVAVALVVLLWFLIRALLVLRMHYRLRSALLRIFDRLRSRIVRSDSVLQGALLALNWSRRSGYNLCVAMW